MKILDPVPLDPMFEHTPIWKDAPAAPVVRTLRHGSWIWEVVRCPYCGERHEHGGEPMNSRTDMRSLLGGRISPCSKSPWCDHSIEYRLVAIEPPIDRGELVRLFPRATRAWDTGTRKFVEFSHWETIRVADGGEDRAIVNGRQPIAREIRAAVWDKSHGHCWYCGVRVNPFVDFHVDHVQPIADGGSNELVNLVPSCKTCNLEKSAMAFEVFRHRRGGGLFWFEIACGSVRLNVDAA